MRISKKYIHNYMKINMKFVAKINDAGIKIGVLYFRTLFGHENFGIYTKISYSKTALLYKLEFTSETFFFFIQILKISNVR